MNPEQQNKTIAKHCNWKQSRSSMWQGWWHQNGQRTYQRFPPDYCKDLNAMHEAEKTLNPIKTDEYARMLTSTAWQSEQPVFAPMTATAAQRAEAFLRTINLWKEQ
jgi:hypothetical protein